MNFTYVELGALAPGEKFYTGWLFSPSYKIMDIDNGKTLVMCEGKLSVRRTKGRVEVDID